MTGTSVMSGTAESSTGSSASNEAAMSFRTEFLAPESRTVPSS